MDALLHRIEALPGDGRYAVTFRRPDGGEQSTVAQVAGDTVTVAESGLPTGWTTSSDAFKAVARAVSAVHESRRSVGRRSVGRRSVGRRSVGRRSVGHGATLCDVDGGWDVGLGNVVLAANGIPECIAHGAMAESRGSWVCGQCQARAELR